MARKSRKNQGTQPVETAAPLYKVGVYVRLSRENKEDMESNSLSNQKKICMAYLEKQPDMEYCQTYMDNGMTGTNFARPGFQRMLDDIEKSLINCIIVKDLSRFGRNFIETSMYLDLKFPEWGVRLIAVNNGFDSLFARYEGGGYDISVPFYNIMAEWYAADIGRKVKTAVRARMKEAVYLTGEGGIPFGYLLDREKHAYVIDPVGAEIVRYIYRRRAEGATRPQIRDELNAQNAPTPVARKIALGIYDSSSEKYCREGLEIWSDVSVTRILQNNAYSGVREHLKADKTDETIVIENAHEAIVPAEIFRKARQVEEERREAFIERNTMIHLPDYKAAIRGRILCGVCGKPMYVTDTRSRNHIQSFSCSTYIKDRASHREPKCVSNTSTSNQFTRILISVLQQHIDVTEDMERTAAEMEAEVKSTPAYKHYQSKQRSIRVRLNNARSRLAGLPRDLVEGRIPAERYEKAKEEYAEKVRVLEVEEQEVREFHDECFSSVLRLRKAIDVLNRFQKTGEVDEELLIEMVRKVRIFPDKRVEITLNYQDFFKPDAVLGGSEHE